MNYQIKTANKAAFDIALLAGLNAVGTFENPERIPEKGNINVDATNPFTDDDGIESTVSTKINVDWYRCFPDKIVDGEKVNTGTEEEPVYEKYEGYHVEVASNVLLGFSMDMVKFPEIVQYKWM
jgi:hypothetical protein